MSVETADTELKGRHRKMWASGDYPTMVETFLLPLGPRLVEACGIGPGTRVLDVAAGNGNATLAAARRWCDVVSTDYVPSLLERGRLRAAADGAARLIFGDIPVDFPISVGIARDYATAK